MKIIFVFLVIAAFLIFRKKSNETSEVNYGDATQDDTDTSKTIE